jgi:DNA modification methylase
MADFILEDRDPRALTAHPLNWRRHPQSQRDVLAYSLRKFGHVQGVLVNRQTGHLIDGHARVEEAIEQGRETIPVNVVDLSEEDERELLRLFDPVGALADTDSEALERLIAEIGNPDLEAMLAGVSGGSGLLVDADPDAIPEGVEPRCKPGDLWRLGEHRLLCGDSTDRVMVERLMGGERSVLMNTDPPYGVNLDQGWRDRAGINRLGPAQDDAISGDEGFDWVEAFPLAGARVAYVWHASACHAVVSEALESAGYEVKQQIVWVKPVHALSRACYHWKHEPCWFAVKKGQTIPWHAGRDQMTVWEAAAPKMIFGHSEEEKFDHPVQKPVELSLIPIRNHTVAGEVVYDPFLGSGTTSIGCETLGRRCYGLELEPKYCDVILARWESATGRSAERIDA